MFLIAIIMTLLLVSFLLAFHSLRSEVKKHHLVKEAEKELSREKILFQHETQHTTGESDKEHVHEELELQK